MLILIASFYLNCDTAGFQPQIHKLGPCYASQGFTLRERIISVVFTSKLSLPLCFHYHILLTDTKRAQPSSVTIHIHVKLNQKPFKAMHVANENKEQKSSKLLT